MIPRATCRPRSTCRSSRGSSPLFPPVFVFPRSAPDSNPPEPLPQSAQTPLSRSACSSETVFASLARAFGLSMQHTSLSIHSGSASIPGKECFDACPTPPLSLTSSTMTSASHTCHTVPALPSACISSLILSHLPLESKIPNGAMDRITMPSALLSCLLLIPLRGQESCQKQVVIRHRGR